MVSRRVMVCLFVVAASFGCEPGDVDPQAVASWSIIAEQEAFVKQHESVRTKATRFGGKVSGFPESTDEGTARYSLRIDFTENPQATDTSLKNLLDGTPSHLFLRATPITDEGLAAISQDPGITVLDLSGTSIGEVGIGYVSTLPSLKVLGLGKTNITEAGLRALSTVSTLEQLYLRDTIVRDDGVALLMSLPRLTSLNLDGTQVTDDVIDQLSKIKSLKDVRLSRTDVTSEGAERLQRELPECKVHFIANLVGICDLLPLIAEEHFGSTEDVLIVTTPLRVAEYDLDGLSRVTKFSAEEIVHIIQETNESWSSPHPNCAGWKSLTRMDEGCRETLLFPVAESASNRLHVTHPLVLGEGRVAMLVNATNCRTHFVTKLYVLVKKERWEIESATIMSFV